MATDETYSVSQVARIIGIAPNTVRDWTARFAIDAQPDAGEERRYTAGDVALFQTVKVLRDQGEPMKRIMPRIVAGERLEPPPDTPPDRPETAKKRETGEPKSAVMTEREAKMMRDFGKLQGEFDTIKLERDYLRQQVGDLQDARIDAEKRAVAAETEVKILRELVDRETPPDRQPGAPGDAPGPAPSLLQRFLGRFRSDD